MTNIKSTITEYQGQQVTLANLDHWLKESIDKFNKLTERVSFLEQENLRKDTIIEELKKSTATSTTLNSQQSNIESSAFWSKLPKAAISKQCNLITKENNEKSSKENNVMIFGLKINENSEDLQEVDKILKAIDISINIKKVNRFKSNNTEKAAPIQVILNSKEEKINVLKAAKKLKEKNGLNGIFINPDYTKNEMDLIKSLNAEKKQLNEQLSEEENGKRHGMHKFGKDDAESKFFWGIRDFELKRIKCN